jgi:hypothetical protein
MACAQLAGGCLECLVDSGRRALLPGLVWSRQRRTGLPGCVRMFRHLFFLQTGSDRALGRIAASISLRRPSKCRSASSPFEFAFLNE